jgi:predicted SPOUT superfamily RNA methylase MTH1
MREGLYWGYSVRYAPTLATVLTQAPYMCGYDLSVGTSAKAGNTVAEMPSPVACKHMLVVFGGVDGLAELVAQDTSLSFAKHNPASLFDHYVNVCPTQGTRVVRTEEAIPVALALIKPHLEHRPVEHK